VTRTGNAAVTTAAASKSSPSQPSRSKFERRGPSEVLTCNPGTGASQCKRRCRRIHLGALEFMTGPESNAALALR
jgi:hypothetical protein